ncbi:DUF6335 family protein [Leptolyngbya sp. AN02str]|uniref:DUF6335 family protein n=1 Tax=Leptolyngbya sp. AN02str TaxID=3423363 RepID=UPI003D311890
MDSAKRTRQDTNLDSIRSEVEQEFDNEFGTQAPIDSNAIALSNLADEIGLEEVELNQGVIDTIATNNTNDNLNGNDDVNVDAMDDQEQISDLPQELTESYGTGLQGQPSDRAGRYSRREEHILNEPDYTLTGGDVDANYEDAESVGEEGVGGTAATPDQDVVEDLAAAVGIQMDDRSFLRTNDMLEQRDDRRWELDPKSSEDYSERRD